MLKGLHALGNTDATGSNVALRRVSRARTFLILGKKHYGLVDACLGFPCVWYLPCAAGISFLDSLPLHADLGEGRNQIYAAGSSCQDNIVSGIM